MSVSPGDVRAVGISPIAVALMDTHLDDGTMTSYDDNSEVLDELDLMNDVGEATYNLALIGTVGGPRAAARIADDLCGQLEEAVRLMGKVPASRAQLAKVLVDHVRTLTEMTQGWASDELAGKVTCRCR